MTYAEILSVLGSWAAILTALIAVFGYLVYRNDGYQKRLRLEKYLKNEKQAGSDKGQRSSLHLIAKLGLTEDEILQSSFRSKHIARRVAKDKETWLANVIFYEWTGPK